MSTLPIKHFLKFDDFSREEIEYLLKRADFIKKRFKNYETWHPLQDRSLVMIFEKASTRTRLSFEAAAKRLSADVINFSAKGSSLSKGESLKDTAQTIMAMGADAVVVRHSACGAAHLLAHAGWINVPVLNAGDGTHQHPTQALLDAMTLRRWYVPGAPATADGTPAPQGRDLEEARVIIVGDVLHSRVARSNVDLMTALGAQVTLVAPPTLLPVGMGNWPCEVSYNLDEAIETVQPDAVMMLRVQRERMSAAGGGFFPSPAEYSSVYGLNSARRRAMPEHAIVMHPGPMNRGLEITAEAADDPRSRIIEQVGNGVSVRMAALYLLLADEGNQL